MPMMAITTSNSTSVKPVASRAVRRFAVGCLGMAIRPEQTVETIAITDKVLCMSLSGTS